MIDRQIVKNWSDDDLKRVYNLGHVSELSVAVEEELASRGFFVRMAPIYID